MKLYLVRHGESEGNRLNIHQLNTTPLSDIGLDQAKLVGHRFKKIQVEALLASPAQRAQQTAQEISKTTGLKVETMEELNERKVPSQLLGLSVNDPGGVKIKKQIEAHQDEPNWKYSDEETLPELAARAELALQLISQRPEENIAAVSHSFFIRALLLAVLFKDFEMSVGQMNELMWAALTHSNTGITVLEFDRDKELWKLVTWNDHAHLG